MKTSGKKACKCWWEGFSNPGAFLNVLAALRKAAETFRRPKRHSDCGYGVRVNAKREADGRIVPRWICKPPVPRTDCTNSPLFGLYVYPVVSPTEFTGKYSQISM